MATNVTINIANYKPDGGAFCSIIVSDNNHCKHVWLRTVTCGSVCTSVVIVLHIPVIDSWDSQMFTPSLRPTATLTASLSSLRPQVEIGSAKSQSLEWFAANALNRSLPRKNRWVSLCITGLSQTGCLWGLMSSEHEYYVHQRSHKVKYCSSSGICSRAENEYPNIRYSFVLKYSVKEG